MPNSLTVYRWELRKLIAQKRTYLGLVVVALIPLAFVVALTLRRGGPNDVAFGDYVHQSGLAIPLVILIFAANFILLLVTALVAGTSSPTRITTARSKRSSRARSIAGRSSPGRS